MLNSVIQFVVRFCREESGQANQEYGSILAFSVFILCCAVGMFFGIQHGFIHGLSGAMVGHMNSMAANADQNMRMP